MEKKLTLGQEIRRHLVDDLFMSGGVSLLMTFLYAAFGAMKFTGDVVPTAFDWFLGYAILWAVMTGLLFVFGLGFQFLFLLLVVLYFWMSGKELPPPPRR